MTKIEQLPFEENNREIIIKKEVKTSEKFGKDPYTRNVEELINNGIININKPKGPTSHQVSSFVQNILNIKKSGHSGTLDPKVTGVLPVALEKATRIVNVLLPAGKEYVCLMHLHDDHQEYEIRKIMASFVGEINQLPPIKSAVKRQYRIRKIYYIKIHDIIGKDVLFTVGCQAGTYIRKLCLHPETEIITNKAQIQIKDLFTKEIEINTIDKGKTKKRLPTEKQKFIFKGDLIKINMTSGISFMITPNHKMLISTNDGYVMKEARYLKTNDYIVKSINPNFATKKIYISDLLDDKFLINQTEIKEKVKNEFIKKYNSIRNMNKITKRDRKPFLKNSKIAISLEDIKNAKIYDKLKSKLHKFKTEKGTEINISKIDGDIMYLIGLIASDGNNTKEKNTIRHTRIKFFNKEKILIDKFELIYKKLFPKFNLKIKKVNNLYHIESSNSFLATICANLGIKSPYKNNDILPILYMEKDLIKSFLRGYFDGDGSSYIKEKSKHKGRYTKIDFYTINEIKAKRLHQMLLKLNIANKIFKSNNKYVISITDILSKQKFISEVGTCHPLKIERFNQIKKIKTYNYDSLLVGFHYKKNILNVIKKIKLNGNLHRIIYSNSPISREFYEKIRREINIPELDNLCIEKIKSIEKQKYYGEVFDMTVPKTHNYLIETGFISSNCHDIGKKLGSGGHMSQLIRTKAGPFILDKSWTLQDLKDAYYYYKEENNDKFIKKIIKPIEEAVTHLPKIWVMDTTVDSICHGSDIGLPGISKFESNIKENETVAVFTLKNELICIGTTKMSSDSMLKEKGRAIKIEKVFMEPGTYPKYNK